MTNIHVENLTSRTVVLYYAISPLHAGKKSVVWSVMDVDRVTFKIDRSYNDL